MVLKVGPHPDRQRLESQLEELQAQREHLLESLTEAHPDVVDVEERIASVKERIASLADTVADPAAAKALAEQAEQVTRQWSEYVQQHQDTSKQAASTYQRLFDEWEAAQRHWDEARAAEATAADRLASLQQADEKTAAAPPTAQPAFSTPHKPPAELPPVVPVEPPRKAAPLVPAGHSGHGLRTPSSTGSQSVALAALLVALAVAALAAVRLARSSADPTFASADEAAAALALPVVGIVPATSRRSEATRYRTGVANGVDHRTGGAGHRGVQPDRLCHPARRSAVRACTDPLANVRSLLGR